MTSDGQPLNDNDRDPDGEPGSGSDAADFWFARVNGGGPVVPADAARFNAWIQADPGHARAYRDCQTAWLELGLGGSEPEILALRSRALKVAAGTGRRRLLFGLAGSGAAAALAGVAWVTLGPSPARALIVTGKGQRLTAPLPDGSEVTLAPLTRLRLAFTDRRRALTLEAGQAYFNVVGDPDRPFAVEAGNRRVTATGTRFQITLAGTVPEIVLEEGRVEVAVPGDPTGPIRRLAPGQRLIASGEPASGGPDRIETADVEASTAWRSGRLVVSDRPLHEVVAAFNRYSGDRLTLGDPALADLKISGSFRYDGAREFALALETSFGLRVRPLEQGAWRIDRPARASEGTTTVP